MTLRRKFLIRISLLTFLLIIAMSGTYYMLFTRDVRERSHQNVEMTFNLICDDLSAKVGNIDSQLNRFVQSSLIPPLYTAQMLLNRQPEALQSDVAALTSVKQVMTYLHTIVTRMHEFGKLVEASEIMVYGEKGTLLAVYQQQRAGTDSFVYLPGIRKDRLISIQPEDRWFVTMQSFQELPEQGIPETLELVYADPIPAIQTVKLITLHNQLNIQLITPILERGNLQGVCLVNMAIRQQDVERYASLTGNEVNVFAGTALSVGSLPDYNFFPDAGSALRQSDAWLMKGETPHTTFSDMTVRKKSYYQGVLAFGTPETFTGAITVLFPRWLEEQQKRNFLMIVALVTFGFSLLVVIESIGLSGAIGAPIAHLMTTMQTIKTGNLDVQAPVETNDEIGKLAETFNLMTAQLKQSFTRIEQEHRQVERQNRELQRLDKLKDEFLANTSHELRTPLNGIAGLSEALLQGVDGPLNEQERKHVRMILQSSQRLAHLVNEVLDFSKVRSETLTLHRKPFPLSAVTEIVLAFSQELIGAKPVTLCVELPPDLPELYADIDRVEQILTNLVGNAIKFTRQGAITITATQYSPPGRGQGWVADTGNLCLTKTHPQPLPGGEFTASPCENPYLSTSQEGISDSRSESKGAWLQIAVQDTGIGIPPEDCERIFHPFEQLDGSATREFGGTGLGLAITKDLVELHGGRIWVESQVGVGSTFYVTLPCQAAAAEAQAAQLPQDSEVLAADVTGFRKPVTSFIGQEPQREPPSSLIPAETEGAPPSPAELTPALPPDAQIGAGRTIMVIDDDPTNLEVLRTQLTHVGFTVLAAANGKHAFEVVNGFQIDLILCDVMMPLVDGYTFAMRMRDHDKLRHIPLIFVSAKDQPQDIAKGYQAGGIDYLTKPVHHAELLLKVQALLHLQQRVQEHYAGADTIQTRDTLYDTEQEKDRQYTAIHHGQGERVLVVDDEPINLEVIKAQLTQYHYQVITATNGPEALEKMKTDQPDLVLLDLMMPKMSGFRVCQIIRQELQLHSLPVIMLTAKSNIYDKVYGLNIGANDYVLKPFHRDELLTRMYVWLSITMLQRELLTKNEALLTEVIERKQAEEAVRQLNTDLEHRVEERTWELQASLDNLKKTQQHLVQSEKMAALGALTAGIAHEINTPVGVGITAASHIQLRTDDLHTAYSGGNLTKHDLEQYLAVMRDSAGVILRNLQHTAVLIQNFKQAAVDESDFGRRRFPVKPYIEDALHGLRSELEHTQHQIVVEGDEDLSIDSYPGALSQIVTSLVMNSIMHAYPEGRAGRLIFQIIRHQERILIQYTDDGCGISPEHLSKIFDPFFTTARIIGGSGLGLHVVYNLVTQKMKGHIHCESAVGHGTTFVLHFPVTLPAPAPAA